MEDSINYTINNKTLLKKKTESYINLDTKIDSMYKISTHKYY